MHSSGQPLQLNKQLSITELHTYLAKMIRRGTVSNNDGNTDGDLHSHWDLEHKAHEEKNSQTI